MYRLMRKKRKMKEQEHRTSAKHTPSTSIMIKPRTKLLTNCFFGGGGGDCGVGGDDGCEISG